MLAFLEMLERWMYRAADRIVAVGNGYKEHIAGKLGSADRISVITNGVDAERFSPRPADGALKKRFHLGDRFVCSYIGTIGMAHGLEVVIRAAQMLKQQGAMISVFFWWGTAPRGPASKRRPVGPA